MAFNLYFASFPGKPAQEYINEKGIPKLYLQNTHRKHIKEMITAGYDGKLFIDSGAYTAHTQHKMVDVDDYIDFINEYSEHFECIAQLDTIPGEYKQKKTVQQLAEAPEHSWENYLYMIDKVKEPKKILPIYHQGEDFYHLSRMLEWTDKNGEHIPYIGISPANDLTKAKKLDWISQCFWIIKNSSNPNVKTHAFGFTALDALEAFPFYSADSTSYIIASSSGSFYTPFGMLDYSQKSKKHYTDTEKAKHRKYVESIGCNYDEAISPEPNTWLERCLISVIGLHNWAQNYEYKGTGKFQRPLFFRKYKNK